MIEPRDCLHNDTFAVKNKRGQRVIYCRECMSRLKFITEKEFKVYFKRRAKNGKD